MHALAHLSGSQPAPAALWAAGSIPHLVLRCAAHATAGILVVELGY